MLSFLNDSSSLTADTDLELITDGTYEIFLVSFLLESLSCT